MSPGYQGPGIYEHYKGGRYNVYGLGTETETGEIMVVYAKFGDKHAGSYFLRPLEDFNDQLGDTPRFKRVGA